MKQSQENKTEIAVLKANAINRDKKLDRIEAQVSNHIPTAIEGLKDFIIKNNDKQDKKIEVLKAFVMKNDKLHEEAIKGLQINQTLLIAKVGGVVAVIVFLIQYFLK